MLNAIREWLRGPQGIPGPKGEVGARGLPGPPCMCKCCRENKCIEEENKKHTQ